MVLKLPFNKSSPVRIAVYVDEPFVFECFQQYPSIKCTSPGLEIEYIHTVIRGMLELPIEWIKVKDRTAIMHAIDTRTADIAGTSLPQNTSFIESWGIPPPNSMYDNIAFVARESEKGNSHVLQLLDAFTWDMWSAIVVFTLTFVFARYASKKLRNEEDFHMPILRCYSTFAHFFRAYVCYSLWFVLLSFLLNFYSNLIAVDLIRPSTVKSIPFTTLDDLGAKLLNQECKLSMMSHYKNGYEFDGYVVNPQKTANKTWAATFAKAYKVNKPIYVNDREEMAELVLKSECVVGLDYGTMDTYYITRYCDIRLVSFQNDLPLFGYVFYNIREDIKEAVARVVTSLPFQSYPNYLNRKYFTNPVPPVCKHRGDLSTIDIILTLTKVQDCFYILLFGLMVSFLAISLQLLSVRFSKAGKF